MSVPVPEKVNSQKIQTPYGDVWMTGPSLSEGPLPAFIYYSISGEESLTLDPFNQPVAFLKGERVRCFSITLPYHGDGYDKVDAMGHWSQAIGEGEDILNPFIDQSEKSIRHLIDEGVIDSSKIAVGGLSRGGFIACHLAARFSEIDTVVAFAPVTDLSKLSGFPSHPLMDAYALDHLYDKLYNKKIRFFIGNLDTRVGTDACFAFIYSLSQYAQKNKVRSPSIELIINPSIGHKGHGTPPDVFYAGAKWISKQLTPQET